MTTPTGPEMAYTDPGPVPIEQPFEWSRSTKIAAIHSYANWLAEHPDVPMPDKVMGTVRPQGSSVTQMDILERFGEQFGLRVHSNTREDWALIFLTPKEKWAGIEISHSVTVATADGAL